MKKLLKTYGFNSRERYFDMCIESHINGQRTQAKEQFNAMPKEERKMMLEYLDGNVSDRSIMAFFLDCI